VLLIHSGDLFIFWLSWPRLLFATIIFLSVRAVRTSPFHWGCYHVLLRSYRCWWVGWLYVSISYTCSMMFELW
jgi:hypothetical protein